MSGNDEKERRILVSIYETVCCETDDIADIGVVYRARIHVHSRDELDRINRVREDNMARWGYYIYCDFNTEPELYCSSCGMRLALEDVDEHLVRRRVRDVRE